MPPTRHTRRDRASAALPAIPGLAAMNARLGIGIGTPSSNSITSGTPDAPTSPSRRPKRSARTDDVVQRGLDAARILQAIGDSSKIAGLQAVASTCAAMLATVQTVRTNKSDCLALLERVHTIVRTIINLTSGGGAAYLNGGPVCGGVLPPALERGVAQFADTLTRLHAFLAVQARAGLFARILRHAETQAQLAECRVALEQALELFGVQTALVSSSSLGGLRRDAAARHAEVLRALGR
ncbi:hypothetical protein B0H10DRAFT_1990110 [Mycena sp. CBHHK59/15]|nr:hypothetical protein B0H10DRAFT_1990110 [Mycena sp. CBHHK59/15]